MSEAFHVEAVDVRKSYRLGENDVWALRGVSLNLQQGEFVALCGSSGSGKTTLLNLFGCLDLPTQGKIVIGGRDISTMTDDELARFRATRLGFVFQTFNLLPTLSAAENVEYPLLGQGLTAKARRAAALESLRLVGLEGYADRRPDQLSGGQRQRVAIARAFVRRPPLIIADEPTANLDKKTAGEVLDLIGELNVKTGNTVIIATHDPLVMQRVRRIVNISDGVLA